MSAIPAHAIVPLDRPELIADAFDMPHDVARVLSVMAGDLSTRQWSGILGVEEWHIRRLCMALGVRTKRFSPLPMVAEPAESQRHQPTTRRLRRQRRKLLWLLSTFPAATTSELAAIMRRTVTAVRAKLYRLEAAGLVYPERDGKHSRWFLTAKAEVLHAAK